MRLDKTDRSAPTFRPRQPSLRGSSLQILLSQPNRSIGSTGPSRQLTHPIGRWPAAVERLAVQSAVKRPVNAGHGDDGGQDDSSEGTHNQPAAGHADKVADGPFDCHRRRQNVAHGWGLRGTGASDPLVCQSGPAGASASSSMVADSCGRQRLENVDHPCQTIRRRVGGGNHLSGRSVIGSTGRRGFR
jgi:hypothetical protein